MASSFKEFCSNSSFWEASGFSDNNSFPEFTKCFQSTVPVWIPCGWLWMTLPVNIYLTKTSNTPRIPVTALNISKLILDIILVVMTIIDAISEVSEEKLSYTVPNIILVSGIINAITFGLAAVYSQLDRIRGNISSASLFVFWLLKVVCNIIEFYTSIVNKTYDDNRYRFILFYILYLVLVVQLILHSFAEKQSSTSEISEISENNEEICPEEKASVLNLLYFWWMNSIIVKAFKKPLQDRDVWTLLSRDQSHNIVSNFDKNWRKALFTAQLRNRKQNFTVSSDENTRLLGEHLAPFEAVEQRRHKPSLFKTLFKSFGWTYMMALLFKLLSDILQFVGPLLISLLIDYADNRTEKPAWKGYLPSIGIFVAGIVQSVFNHQNYKQGVAVGMRVRCSLIAAIYKKALTMNSDAKRDTTLGEIVSLMSVDCQRLQDLFSYLWCILSVPVQVAIGIYLLWGIVGISCLAGIAVLLLLVLLNTFIAFKQLRMTVEVLALKGERIKLMNEILSGIKVLKMYAWEPSFKYQILEIRRREMNKLIKVAYLQGITTFGWLLAPVVVTIATFATYVTLSEDHYLSANKAFVALALFNVLRLPINTLAQTICSIIQAQASLKRVSKFISGEDLDPGNVQHVFDTGYAIKIQRGTFTWDKESHQPTLRDINITIPDGQLVAVVGKVGAGKSSLMLAMLGELMTIEGTVSLKGSVAYVPQEAWIQNATLMDNILFGKTFMQKKYKRVIEHCAMTSDLNILPGRDLTEIGEKGINLSGGQKQRVNLARAVYSNSDIYLMDDPLSAVDVHVGKYIFEKVIGNKGLLRNKTRVLITHGIHWLPLVDNIIVMVNGRITEMGSYENLINHDGPFAQYLKNYLIEEAEDNVDDTEIQKIRAMILDQVETVTSDGMTSDEPSLTTIREREKLNQKERGIMHGVTPVATQMKTDRQTRDEESQTGGIKLAVYSSYAKALGVWATIVVFLVFSLYHGISVYASFWLTYWTSDPYLTNQTNVGKDKFYDKVKYYLYGYGLLGIIQAVLVLIYAILVSVKMVYAAGKLHNDLLNKIMRASMKFFDTTPIVRIINRFSSDVDVMDVTLPLTFHITINSVYLAVTTMIVICINTPIIFTTVLPVAILYGLVMIFYIPTSRQLKRLESVSRSPLYNHFSETVTGASVIRAYKASERFMEEALKRLDKNMVFYYAFFNAARWLGVHLELLGNVVVLAAALFSVFSDLDGALVGLSVVYAIQATYILNLLVMNLSDLQSNILCVERIKEYTDIDEEGQWRSDRKPPSDWPMRGDVTFEGYKMKYRPGGELVLRGIDIKIYHNEKIGIVGRTGAGKSAMALALFRLVEASSGEIIIDGINISSIGLHDLREKITILPQDPVLFSCSLRLNLDPFGCYGDDQLWTALQQSHLKDYVISLQGQLDYQCGEGGQNLSIGQRQLVCLARTLLKDTKILVLDEATAAIDLATDELIQQTILKEFKDCTVIYIAHRLKTVLDYDRIIVMDNGLVKECDTPDNLLADEGSVFYGLSKEAGVISSINTGNQEQQEREGTSPNIDINKGNFSCDEMLPLDDDNGSEKSSNGWTSHSDRSGNEGSVELSNDHEKNKISLVETISVDSVRFGDVTMVTPQDNPPLSFDEYLEATPTNIILMAGSDEISGNPSVKVPSKGDNSEALIDHTVVKSNQSIESSVSNESEYFSADSQEHGYETFSQSPIDNQHSQSSGEEQLM